MEYTEDFKYAMGWNLNNLKIMGAWPESNAGFFTRQKAWFVGFTIFLIIYLPQTASIYVYWGDMDVVIECITVNGSLLFAILKIFIFRYHRQVLSIMIDIMDEDWKAPRVIEERQAMLITAKISHKISVISTIVTSTLFVAYIIFRIWAGLEMNKQTDLDPRLSIGLPHTAYFPYDTKKLQYFLPTWIGQCIATFLCMAAYATFDTFIAAMMLHICGQLRTVGISLKNLVNEKNQRNSKTFSQKFSALIKRHEKLNQLSYMMENSFNKVLLFQMVTCTLTFCFQGFSIIGSLMDKSANFSILEMLFSIVYVIYTSLHLYVYCYVGDYISYESTYLSQNFYESNWYNLPPQQSKWLILVGHRSQKALTLSAGKFCTFSIHLFILVIKTSVGYLSMLLTVKQRNLAHTM